MCVCGFCSCCCFFPSNEVSAQAPPEGGLLLKVIVRNSEITLTTRNLSHDLRITVREQLVSTRFQHYPYNCHNLLSCREKKKKKKEEAKCVLPQQRSL